MKEEYLKAMEIWEVPEEFYQAAEPMYRDYEVKLAGKMGKETVPGEKICRWLEEMEYTDREKLLCESYSRNVMSKDQENPDSYKMTTFYDRYPYFAQYEPEAYAEYSQEMVRKLNDWDLKVYMDMVADKALAIARGENVPMHQTQYLTLEEAMDMMDTFGDEILILPCNCKAMERYKDKPVNVCINKLEKGPNTPYDRGHGEIFSREETKQWIREVNKKGLMQSGENGCLCSCDGVCCYPVKMAKILGTRLRYPTSHYEIIWDKDKCVQCGKCAKICNFGAFVKEGKKVTYDVEKCWGCTICAPNCPKGAITLKKRRKNYDS